MALADMVLEIFAVESSVLRAMKGVESTSAKKKALLEAVVRVVAYERSARFQLAATRCCTYALEGVRLLSMQRTVARFSAYPVPGLLGAKQLLADAAREEGKYLF